MPRLSLPTIETAPEDSKPRLQAALKNNGFLPNLVRLLSNAPVALETYQTVGAINARSGLSLAEREAVQITAAAVHGCGFCVAGHTAVAYKQAKLSEQIVEALRDGTKVSDERLDAVVQFTRAVIRSRGDVEDSELAAFRAAGFTEANALEVVLGVSLAPLCKFANNLGRTDLNPELSQYAWKGSVPAAAE